MNITKKKDIFSKIAFSNNSGLFSKIKSSFGDRVIDILIHLPKDILKKNLLEEINISNIDQLITIDLKVEKHIKNFNRRLPYKIVCKNKLDQQINLLFFNIYQSFITKKFENNKIFRVTGKLSFFSNFYQIAHPISAYGQNSFSDFEEIEPIYNLDRTGINKKTFRKLIIKNLDFFKKQDFPDEWILKEFFDKKWSTFKESILKLHLPNKKHNSNILEVTRKRLAFDEILSSFLIFKNIKSQTSKKNFFTVNDNLLSKKIINELDFNLTKDQKICLKEILNDLKGYKKMYRLLQGDVGSGKTIVALLSIADVINSGYQSVIMAPTELLANQHYEYFNKYLSSHNIRIAILTGNTKDKEDIYKKVENAEINLLIGTHSVYNKSLKFKNLGLIVIDEQHKFGVKQRVNLLEKSLDSHTLVMSATPIPRSLSFVMYGEVSISNIKTKPEGRKKVVTSIISNSRFSELLAGIKRKLSKNEQVFWILPYIGDEVEQNTYETVLSRFNFLNKKFKNITTLVHSKMSKEEIEKNMNDFKRKKKMIMVATTVIEVGINIPGASLMIIESADRCGLAQLHQLRGRISRNKLTSHCVLIHNFNLSKTSRNRLLILKNSDDGFEIAEKDLLLRGTGDILGTNQTGLPNWKFFEPLHDYELIELVKKNCEILLKDFSSNKKKINFLINVFFKDKNLKNYLSA